VVSFDDGEELMYPFDRYRASVDVVVREAAGSEADGSADAGAPVPVALTVESANAGFRFDVTDESEDDGSFGAVRVDVRRSAVPVAMAIVMSIVMLCLAGIVSAVSHLIVTGRRRFEFASLTWMAAMLFRLCWISQRRSWVAHDGKPVRFPGVLLGRVGGRRVVDSGGDVLCAQTQWVTTRLAQ
jgi:hypothetical protein